MFNISQEKLEQITDVINNESDPRATDADVHQFVTDESWVESATGDEHQEWLDTADAQEIAGWMISIVYK